MKRIDEFDPIAIYEEEKNEYKVTLCKGAIPISLHLYRVTIQYTECIKEDFLEYTVTREKVEYVLAFSEATAISQATQNEYKSATYSIVQIPFRIRGWGKAEF